ncbi:MAG: bacillithiol biosynthesis cysteine-adding enzyme BshC [Chitinophagaceae bacterium]|nr:bacillithiol biosynthesis cysteine-adding enzyme BshC [Chitinophagaceae bacterium]
MDCTATRLPYRQTGSFTKIVTDYIDQAASLAPFYTYAPAFSSIQKAIEARKIYSTNRKVLVTELKKQYGDLLTGKTSANIDALLSDDTFTVTTAHQPNILTGPLYFIYKILHAIKLAEHLKTSFPRYNFVPVYYMGSEDADLDELGYINLDGKKIKWETKQTGAVGRMTIDKDFLQVIDAVEGQLGVLPFGKDTLRLVKECYKKGALIQEATFRFVHALFAEYGLVVLIPDNAGLKKLAIKIFEDDLLDQTASELVGKTIEKIDAAGYKVQANPREINLFYLKDAVRERIEKKNGKWRVVNSAKAFTETELLNELKEYPERFSPNVILRGLFQEMILPNLVFIGGGGELAYWLQYVDMFAHYKIPFPLLVLRNSFLIAEKNWLEKTGKLGFSVEDFFLAEQELLNKLVQRESKNQIKLNGSMTQVEQLYELFKKQAGAVDVSLTKHVDALKAKAVYRLQELEKKMLRAEKRKFADQQRQIHTIKSALFPAGGLQERYDNMLYYYAKWGKDFIQQLYDHSLSLEQEFVILSGKS